MRMRFSLTQQSLVLIAAITAAVFVSACGGIIKQDKATPRLLKVEDASIDQLKGEVDRFARVESMRSKMDLKFEDNSFAEFGSKEVYRSAEGEVVVQRPGKILLKVQIPVVKSDLAQMTSDGEKFRVAVLQDQSGGRYKRFLKGTNSADYSELERSLDADAVKTGDKNATQSVSAFKNIRPQHFTDALLVRPIIEQNLYVHSTIFQVEEDSTKDKRSPIRNIMRGYYLLDEYIRTESGGSLIARRFWFDRVGGIRLARQQIFDRHGEIESDIVYGALGNLSTAEDYRNLPLEITVTRPQQRYAMRLTHQNPESVMVGRRFPDAAFVLENTWNLSTVDLDEKAEEMRSQPSGAVRSPF